MIAAKHAAQSAKARDHFIGNQQNIMLFQNRLNGGPIAFWRRHKPPCAQSRFTNEGGNRICAFCFNHRLQIRHALADKAFFALA